MPFEMVSEVGRVMGVLDRGGDRRRERNTFGGEFWASYCNQRGLCCVVVRNCVNRSNCMSFAVMSAVGPGIGVLNGGRRAARRRAVS